MIDLSKTKVDLACPNCKNQFKVTLKDIADERTVCCNRCNQAIKLTDENHSTRKGIKDGQAAFDKMDRTLKSLGKGFKFKL